MSSAIRLIVLPLCLLPGLAGAGVAASVWPGAAPCNTTLQACVDATPNGSGVVIVTDTPIAENINLYNRSISLVAGTGRKPNFAPGHWISVTAAAIHGNQDVTLRGLRLTNAYVNASYGGVGTARYDFSGLVLEQDSGAPTYLRVEARNGATVEARVYDNRVRAQPSGLNAGLIELAATGGTLNAEAYYNQIDNTSAVATDGAGLFVDVTSAGAGRYKLHGNRVRGGFFRSGIFVSEGLFSSTTSSFEARVYSNVVVCADPGGSGSGGSGIGFTVNNGSISAQALNNTLTRCNFGISANNWSGGGGADATISGVVKNNLIVGTRGLTFTAALTPSLSNDYNLLNVASNTAPLGANTITADARLIALTAPRLRADSPAIDAADNAALGLGLIFNALPTNDADGLRRFKGSTSDNADIGAYEYGDQHLLHVARSGNISGHITTIDSPLLNDRPAANPVVTPHWNGSGAGVPNDAALGIYYSGGRWRLFNEDVAIDMPPNAAFNTFVPAGGGGSFRHVSSAGNSSAFVTQLDDSSVNNQPERIILVTQNWSAGSGIYNPHPIGLDYLPGSGGGRWRIVNIDLAGSMPLSAGFNVYAQQASPNAFRVSRSVSGNTIELDHPLLNDTACARPQVTRIYGGAAVPRHFDVYYGSGNGRWRIYSYSALNAADAFNVLVDPAQVADCTDRIFAYGFQ
ncbi:DUF7452 domain-containing protein [Tahibacter harae]|uniref:DUF7452 domain-containing protein n=1 Tax=Tahibacter harae TaxID=2963937 RepID=A0ABT1QPJ0_9GAMM|nr:choice-of-anchor Q domain-containing protein [Tahibacter harae]MCQ4164185.1 hypothetical protein [Tahibacter harae]